MEDGGNGVSGPLASLGQGRSVALFAINLPPLLLASYSRTNCAMVAPPGGRCQKCASFVLVFAFGYGDSEGDRIGV